MYAITTQLRFFHNNSPGAERFPVSYTHLDVYKRQDLRRTGSYGSPGYRRRIFCQRCCKASYRDPEKTDLKRQMCIRDRYDVVMEPLKENLDAIVMEFKVQNT